MYIPSKCYALNNMTIHPETKIGNVIELRALERGFYKTALKATQEEVDNMNTHIGVTRAEAKAMEDATLFNWEMYPSRLAHYQEFLSLKEKETIK